MHHQSTTKALQSWQEFVAAISCPQLADCAYNTTQCCKNTEICSEKFRKTCSLKFVTMQRCHHGAHYKTWVHRCILFGMQQHQSWLQSVHLTLVLGHTNLPPSSTFQYHLHRYEYFCCYVNSYSKNFVQVHIYNIIATQII